MHEAYINMMHTQSHVLKEDGSARKRKAPCHSQYTQAGHGRPFGRQRCVQLVGL